MVRVRFAPSPTGNLHIGGARTALFNWLFARSQKGVFVLRIEDTDKSRSKPEYLEEILFSLNWLGMKWDEIYYQSQRFDIYRDYARKMLEKGDAYLGEALPALEQGQANPPDGQENQPRGKAIIYKVPARKLVINDLIRGQIEFDTSVIKDQVLIKSDGTPSYNFACVIDDALMSITHVIRGDDHISNTPKQVLLYEALGLKMPEFAHLPLILSKEGGRMSKRKGATAISEYRQMGYLPEALVNFLLLLGWSPGDNREIIDMADAVRLFDMKHVGKTAAVFDHDKLDWMNNQYLKKSDPATLAQEIMPLIAANAAFNSLKSDSNYVARIVSLFQSRMTTVNDFPVMAQYFFQDDITIDQDAREKHLKQDLSKEFSMFLERIDKLPDYTIQNIEEAFRKMMEELKQPPKTLIHPIRVALTGKTVGPGLFELIYHLGKDRVRERLSKLIKREVS